MSVLSVKNIHISINCSFGQVYEFVSNPENLPLWASGLSSEIRKMGEEWIAKSPMGKIIIKFAEKNRFGILDHEVTLPSGLKINNPMRVMPNNDGSELIFTLYRQPNMSEEEFHKDAEMVKKDLTKLKTILEAAG
jgi:hypothetical protein